MSRLQLCATLAILLLGSAASARTVEEVLKEKGLITEAEFKEIAGRKPMEYKPGKGFTYTSADGLFQLSIGGRIQVRYTFTDRDDVNGPAQDVSEWRIRRMKLYLSGHAYDKDLTYRLQAALENGSSAKLLDDAYFNYRFSERFQLRAGQFKTPFTRQELISAGSLQFVDRAVVVDAFKPSRDRAADLQSETQGALSYHFAGHNLKVQGDYTNSHVQRGAASQPTDDKQMRVQAQLAF